MLACGNVALIGRLIGGESAAFPARTRELLCSMLRISQMRGAQSGGGAIQIRHGKRAGQLIQKLVNSKRGDLGQRLSAALGQSARSRRAYGSSVLVQTHVRFATAGRTSRHEAHPFRFVEARERGLRRVYDWVDGKPVLDVRAIETALTHNGDMDGLRFRGVTLPHPDLGVFLEHVLGVKNRWKGDSPLLSAAIELYLTRGLWLESLRLAYHLTVAPAPPDPAVLPEHLAGAERNAELTRLFASYPAPSLERLQGWEALAESAFLEEAWKQEGPAESGQRRQRERLAVRLAARFEQAAAEIPKERALAFARAAVNAFFDNDLYVALRKLEPGLLGTFGCVVSSTLEPGCLIVLSRGQPLSLGFRRENALVCVVSERAALKVKGANGELALDERLDLDLCRGEIARVAVDERGPVALTLYTIADGRESTPAELIAGGRLVPLRDNPYVSPLPDDVADRVAADFASIPALLAQIRNSFRDPHAHNAQTARAFADALFRRERPRLLAIGITNDLWLAEQFVHNLRTAFPGIEAEARSSNQVLLDGSELDANTIVLAVSQSGQDFPTLAALVLLGARRTADDQLFVLSSELDSLMGQAVGQSCARGAAFSARIFSNCSGFRPSEAAVASVNATHHTLVELVLSLSARGADAREFARPPFGLRLDAREVQLLGQRRDHLVDQHATVLTQPSGALSPLAREPRRWAWHVLEAIVAVAVVLFVLEANLVFGLGILPSRAFAAVARLFEPGPELVPALAFAGKQADVVFYGFLGPLAVWGLRAAQGRRLLHRHGARELLIGDTRYVHRIAWLLSRKLFSLSFGFSSIKPYSADSQDELVMTHEPLRGTLALIGIPDGRRAALKARAAAASMSAKQFAYSQSFGGSGAEIITVSHAPGGGPGTHIALPNAEFHALGAAAESLLEGLFDSWERLLAFQVFLDGLARGVSRFGLFRYDRSRTKDQVFAPTTASPVSAAAVYQLLSRSSERYEHAEDPALPFEVVRSEWRPSAPAVRTTVWRV